MSGARHAEGAGRSDMPGARGVRPDVPGAPGVPGVRPDVPGAPGVPGVRPDVPGAPAGRSGARPIGVSVFRTGLALACAFAILAVGAGWWQVAEAQRLSTAADNPAVIALARRTLRGPIVDRDGVWLARSDRDQNGEATRRYRDTSISHVVGYASRQFGTSGLERAYNAQLLGLVGSDPFGGLTDKFNLAPREPLGLRLSLDLTLQRAAVKALGRDFGAVVMLDPATGEILALASTPTYDASAIANPETAADTFAALRQDKTNPLLPRATLGRYVPGSVLKIVTAIAALESRSITPTTTFEEQPPAEKKGLLVNGFRIRDGHHSGTGEHAPGPGRRDGGELQHLLRACRPPYRRRKPDDDGRRPRVRGGDPVRPADGHQPHEHPAMAAPRAASKTTWSLRRPPSGRAGPSSRQSRWRWLRPPWPTTAS